MTNTLCRCGCSHRLLRAIATITLVPAALAGSETQPVSSLTLVGSEVFLESPRPGVRVGAFAEYTRVTGLELICYASEATRSDTADAAYRRFSSDNGRTWSRPETLPTWRQCADGVRRRYVRSVFVDPDRDVMLTLIMEGLLPTDDPLEGMKHWRLLYALSRDGGRTFFHEAPVVQSDAQFTPEHPLPEVWIGKNGVMIGDTTCVPIRIRTGEILQPVQISPIGADGQYHNPGGGYTWHDAAVLIGRWNARGTLDWRLSSLVRGDPARSTRGMLEPTIAEMPDGRILMVLRGSNDRKPHLPGHRWQAVSRDGGATWSGPQPWRTTDGTAFHSPSSCSQLLVHTNGRVYWIGNISPGNPRGNAPRYPLVIGEVDRGSLLLVRDSICVLDDRRPGDPESLQLSNFHARQDRATGDILVHCSPLGRDGRKLQKLPTTAPGRPRIDWTSAARLYRVRVAGDGAPGPRRPAGLRAP